MRPLPSWWGVDSSGRDGRSLGAIDASTAGISKAGGFAMTQIALLPIAPILLLPFIIVFFILVFPLWLVGIAVLGALMLLGRGVDRIVGRPVSAPIASAFHWTLSWGGLARRRDAPPE